MTVRPADEDVAAVRQRVFAVLTNIRTSRLRGFYEEASEYERNLADDFASLVEGQAAAEQRAADAAKHAEEVTRYANLMVEKADRFELVLLAIAKNAKAWHGNGEEGPRRALAVIANWARNPTFVPPSILAAARAGEATEQHPCPKGDGCALNKGAVHCNHCHRNWPPDETWDAPAGEATEEKETG